MSSAFLSASAGALRPSVFAQLTPKIKALGERCIPLHIGDTYRLPPEVVRQALKQAVHERIDSTRFFKYTHPFGRQELLEALVAKLERDNGIIAETDNLQVSCGATQGLAAVAQTLLNPGDEVLVLSPYWPLIKGIITTVGGVPVEVDYAGAVADPEGVLGPLVSKHTKALYLANPNNPDGRVLNQAQAQRLYDFARGHNLTVWSDEAYEHIVFDGHEKVSIGSLDTDGRVVTVFTFSKSFGMAGIRLGYVCAPTGIMVGLRRVANHQIYNLSDLSQEAGLAALRQPEDQYREALDRQRDAYQSARDVLSQAFPDLPKPQGGAYLFVPFASKDESWETLKAWLDVGVSCAPGEAFGELHSHCLRLCFTAVPEERLHDAVERIRSVG